jgi:dihydroceramidase
VVSYYIAEFWNTISNFNFIGIGLYAAWNCYRLKAEFRDYVTALSAIVIVGLGSMLFHSTLWYSFQLADELPIIYGTCSLVYCFVNLEHDRYSVLSGTLLTVYSIIVTIVYEWTRYPPFFINAHGVLVFLSVAIPFYQIQRLKRRYPSQAKQMIFIHLYNLVVYLFAFGVIWQIDNGYCDQLREWRNRMPFGLGELSQLHAWWHILSGIGVYGTSSLCLYMRQLGQGKPVAIRFFGPYPTVVSTKRKKE